MMFPIYYVTTFEHPGLFKPLRYAFSLLDIMKMKQDTAMPLKYALSWSTKEDSYETLRHLVFKANTSRSVNASLKYFAKKMEDGRKMLDIKHIISFPMKYTLNSMIAGVYYHNHDPYIKGNGFSKGDEKYGNALAHKGCPIIPVSSIRDSRPVKGISYTAVYPDEDVTK